MSASRYKVQHSTSFSYGTDVTLSQQLMRLTPRDTAHQSLQGSTILLEPSADVRSSGTDYFGNTTTYASIQKPHRRLNIIASSTVEVLPPPTPVLSATTPWQVLAGNMRAPATSGSLDAVQYCYPSPHIDIPPSIAPLVNDLFLADRPILEAVMALTTRIYEDFTYKGGVTDVHTPVSEVLANRQGVCQDFAHLQLACLRYVGLPARYVSGYLVTKPAPGQTKMVGSDESHAWISVWTPELGWVDFDPTNNMMPAQEHVVLGWGRDYADVSPVNGFIVGGSGEHKLTVQVDVVPIPERPVLA
jgi:transglutaminase-like putative cysteine protease